MAERKPIVDIGGTLQELPSGDTVGATHGGTGQSAVAAGDVLYGSAADTWSRLAAGTNGDVLTLAAGVPTWAASSAAAGADDIFRAMRFC